MALQPKIVDEKSVNTSVIKDWGHTKHEIKTFQFVWTIQNFSICREEIRQFVESPVFPTDLDAPKWILHAYPKGSTKAEYLAIEILLKSKNKVNAKVQISLKNDKNEKVKTQAVIGRSYEQAKGWIINNFIKLEELSNTGLLPQDTLTILCEVNMVSESVNISGHVNTVVPPSNLSEDLGALYDSGQFSDVKLIADSHVFKAHKAIMSVRSKVFAAMFHHPMKEQISDCVTITDLRHEVLKEMLRFIYTDKVSNLDCMAAELLAVSDKYGMDNLKRMCEESLRANVTIENAADTLILADRHNAKELKSEISKFIAGNAKAVSLTAGWSDITTSHIELIADVFLAIVDA